MLTGEHIGWPLRVWQVRNSRVCVCVCLSVGSVCVCVWFAGEYFSRHGSCHRCGFSCETCTGPEDEDCLTCSRLRLYDNGTCVIHCDTGKYAMDGGCHLCHHTCHECSGDGPGDCTSCLKDASGTNRYLVEGQCRYSCPEGHFPYHWPTHNDCRACPRNCHVCASAETCMHCSPGYYPKDGQCLPLSCGEGEVEDAERDECVTCEEGCERCLKINRFHCNACFKDYFQLGMACHRHCPDGTFGVNSTRTCEHCEPHCRLCDESQCYWCDDNSFLSDDKCVKECADGLYGDEERRECEPCHHGCRTCKGPAHDDCDSCEEDMQLDKGQCVRVNAIVTCASDQFLNGKGKCLPCYSDCSTCSGPDADQCDTCDSGRFLSPDQRCVKRCPAGSFGNESSWRCEECVAGCMQCDNAHSCQHCQSSPAKLYLEEGRCVPQCQGGYPEGGECVPCDLLHCEVCEGPGVCVQCVEQYLLHGHTCVSHCPARYRPQDGQCVRCPAGCSDCHGEDHCTGCEQYYFLHEQQCVDDCPKGFYASVLTHTCDVCHSDCASCDGPDQDDCVECSDRRALRYRGKCMRTCPAKTYHDKQRGECKDCHKTCLTCSGPLPSSCESCGQGMELDATGHCVPINVCPPQSYLDPDGDCQRCHPTCHHCTGGTATQCLSCKQGRFLINNACLKQCPDGYYGDDDDYVCEQCHASCHTCSGRHSTECLSCPEPLFQFGHSCLTTCESGYYGSNGTCQHCDHTCDECLGSSSHCISCKDGYFLLDSQCVYLCPDQYYPHKADHTCQRCHPTCKTCADSGALECTSCHDGFTFMGSSFGFCSSPCLTGLYPSTLGAQVMCEKCDRSCLECKGAGPYNCTECPALQRLAADGRCLSCCGEGQRMDGAPIPRECCLCRELDDGCFLGVNFRFVEPTEQESGMPMGGLVATLVLLAVGVGVTLFLILWLRSTAPRAPMVFLRGYEKIPPQETPLSPDPIMNFRDRLKDDDAEDDEEEEDDIVYMGQDGTMYRKCKYGLLDEHEDDEPELEYDDETYTLMSNSHTNTDINEQTHQ
ncbi:hypothetical protein ACEWY4_012399 [Coilia grayii]|uniref:EGF-like domain-containing protein n=1 Tax=Coilia grayii TaxID=363190 RepID=A0ABD1K0E6_9TELE